MGSERRFTSEFKREAVKLTKQAGARHSAGELFHNPEGLWRLEMPELRRTQAAPRGVSRPQAALSASCSFDLKAVTIAML